MPGREDETGPGVSHLYTDGASRGNPGPSAAAWLVKDSTSDVVRDAGSEYLGRGTNNVAEYKAIIRGLEACIRLSVKRVSVLTDSELCVKQLNGEYRVKDDKLKPLFEKAVQLTRELDDVRFAWVGREDEWISLCDRMVNGELDRHQDEDAAPAPSVQGRP